MADILDLVGECGAVNKPGITAKLHLVCACDVLTFPARKVTTATGDSITLDGDIVLKPGKKFAVIDIITDTGEITHTAVGVRTSKAFTNKLDFKTAKNIASDEWFNNQINGCFVGIVTEKNGTKRVYGNPDVPAFLEASEGKGGMGIETERSWVAQIMDATGDVAPYYEGAIDVVA